MFLSTEGRGTDGCDFPPGAGDGRMFLSSGGRGREDATFHRGTGRMFLSTGGKEPKAAGALSMCPRPLTTDCLGGCDAKLVL